MKEHFKAINLENHLIRIESFSSVGEKDSCGHMHYSEQAQDAFARHIISASEGGATDEQILQQIKYMHDRSKSKMHYLEGALEVMRGLKRDDGSQDALVSKISDFVNSVPHSPFPLSTKIKLEKSLKAVDTKLTFPHRFPLPVMSGLKIAASKLYSNIFHKDDPDVQRFSAPEPGDF